MDRGKPSNPRGAKSKITYPPDIFALGAKSSSSRDNESKRSQDKGGTSKGSADRKREHTSSISGVASSKKAKVLNTVIRSANVASTSSTSLNLVPERASTSSQQSTVEYWETIAAEFEPSDLLGNVSAAVKKGESDKAVTYILGAIKSLKSHRYKPDRVLYFGLLYLAKSRPSLFLNEHVINALASVLKRDTSQSFKSKANPAVAVLCVSLLLKAHLSIPNWPELFVRVYLEDALGDRIWVDHEECKGFVDNILSAFNTRIPPKSLLTPELSSGLSTSRDTASPVPVPSASMDEENLKIEGQNSSDGQNVSAVDNKENIEISVLPRYAQSQELVDQIVIDSIKEQLNRQQSAETVTRNFLRLLSSTSGLIDIRMIAVSKLEMWLHNPKLMRPAQELLAYLCCNCSGATQRDLEVSVHLTKIRLKTKALVNVYLNCLRELITLNRENLPSMLKHTVYNELSNSRNPNNMSMIAVMFQAAPEIAATVLAEIFQDLLYNKDDYLRSLRALLREIVRTLRFDINLFVFCNSLLRERVDLSISLRECDYTERIFVSIADLICMCVLLGITPQVKEAVQLLSRGDKKELVTLQTYQDLVARIQCKAVSWLHESAVRLYRPSGQVFMHVLHKIFFLETADQYYKVDMWPTENDRNFLLRLASEVPLLQETLIRTILIGLSKEFPLNAPDILEITDSLIKRAAALPNENAPSLHIDRLDIIDFIFNLTMYTFPENIALPQGYTPPQLAISNLYWKAWILLLIISAHNPVTFGSVVWKKYPMLRTLMEMCITNHFSYPPPTVAMGETFDEIKNKELQICEVEKQQILEFESHLAAASTKIAITEQNSLLLPQLMEMKPMGDSRMPSQRILEQLHSLNTTHRLGHLLCKSRHPDFLLDIIQRQGSSQHMPWLADLVHNSEGALSHLPVQCLCEYLLISGMQQSVEKNEKHSLVLGHLQTVLTDPSQELNATYEILEYLLRRLISVHCGSRIQAVKGLKMVLSKVEVIEDEPLDEDVILESPNEKEAVDYWLLKQIPALPHFNSIRQLIVASLRQACLVETDTSRTSSYIYFLGQQTEGDSLSDMLDLVLDLSQLIVERSTIIAAILPIPEQENPTVLNTLNSLMKIFCSYLSKAKEARQESFTWSESQEHVLITWPNGDECIMYVLVVQAMIILLTYGPTNNQELFDTLLDAWFPLNSEPPKAFIVDTSEEALLIPDWLKLRMIRSSVSRLVDSALVNLDSSQLVLFSQSFGIPVSSMSKLLRMLDSTVTINPSLIDEAVLDKCYMAQFVEAQHRRGATGGSIFLQVLQLHESVLPDEDVIETAKTREEFPTDSVEVQHVPQIETNKCSELLNKLFLSNHTEDECKKEFRILMKELANETRKNESPRNQFHAVLQFCNTNIESPEFINSLMNNESYSCTLFRLLLSGGKNQVADLIILIQSIFNKIPNKTCPFAHILQQFLQKQNKSNETQTSKRVTSGTSMEILKATYLVSLGKVTKFLVEQSFHDSSNKELVDAFSEILLSDSGHENNDRTGILIDWLAKLEMEIIGSCPEKQMKLLFSNKPVSPGEGDSITSKSFRPYLLTLLAHRASWETLKICVTRLLAQFTPEFDPSAVLEFLWTLMNNPKLWQGQEKSTPKNHRPENILELTDSEILVLVDYILEEACGTAELNSEDEKNSIYKIEKRLPILLQCFEKCKSKITRVVNHLMQKHKVDQEKQKDDFHLINLVDLSTEEPKKNKQQITEEFLVLLYMKVPSIIYNLPNTERKKLNMPSVTEISTSVVDKIAHSLFTMLAVTPRSKDWIKKSQEFEMLARKLAAVHPMLILRQLPMVAGSLKGRTHLDFLVFKSRNHLNFFIQILGITELLQPIIFEKEYSRALDGVLRSYFSLFEIHGHMKELQNPLGRFVILLQSFVSHDSKTASRYLQEQAHLLNNLHMAYPNLRPLRALMSSISLPKEYSSEHEVPCQVGEVLVAVARAPSPEPLPQNWNTLVQSLTNIQQDELPNSLQEIEHISNKRPAILETVVYKLCNLILSPYSAVRQPSHLLLLRYLKHNPAAMDKSSRILSAILSGLNSTNPSVVDSVLEKLPDYVVYLQEHAVTILGEAFALGINSHRNAGTYINKSISVLNMQNGF